MNFRLIRHNASLLLFGLLFAHCGPPSTSTRPVSLDELKVEVFDSSREVGYTNKQSGFYYSETNAEQNSGWQGWHIMSRKILDDYLLSVDGKNLQRSDVQLALVFPHQFTRAYRSGVQETVTLLDSVDAIVVQLSKIKGDSLAVRPLFGGVSGPQDLVVRPEDGMLFVAHHDHLERTEKDDYPAWIGIALPENPSSINLDFVRRGPHSTPALIQGSPKGGNSVAILVAGNTLAETKTLLTSVSRNYPTMIQSRRNRMEGVLQRAFVRTNNERLDKALHWAILSMDALVMNQGKKGIFAGLPWFSNYWGRDSFISLHGATLVSGDFPDAREILRSFADWQQKDPRSPMEGRIPNLVTPTSIAYNTTDGTPWFVISLGEYATTSGDTAFMREMFPVVKRSVEGALRHQVDRNLLLRHEDAETWMDAAGPEGPWSPRGDRANDIQALWCKELLVASWMAEMVGETSSFHSWFSAAEQVRKAFNEKFVDHEAGVVIDHLNTDDTPDHQFRPNQLFTLDLIDDKPTQFSVFKNVTESLVYSYGVGSLSQGDENFHPYHHYAPFYVQDAAYHNGIVWTWLAGPWISAATQFGYTDIASQVTNNMVHQILDRGAVGTMSELLDAAPRKGENEPRLSGTFSQAWSLAEFIRVFYRDYLGVSVDAVQRKIELHPHMHPLMDRARFTIPMGKHRISAELESNRSEGVVRLSSPTGCDTIEMLITWELEAGLVFDFAHTLAPGSSSTINITTDGISYRDSSGEHPITMNVVRGSEVRGSVRLATSVIQPDLKSLRGPSYPILTNAEAKKPADDARTIYQRDDPSGDDTNFAVYPTSPNFKPGILDITHFSVSEDAENVFFRLSFRSLFDPGWHPEYGFQLTFAAIAIDTDGTPGSGQTLIGRNSQYRLRSKDAYESIIFVGGGIRVENATGKILAEYIPIPGDEKNPLGDAGTGTISFSLPKSLIGQPEARWSYTVLVGGQDDHGGAGIGDFRTINARASEWSGGGKKKPGDPNIYDVIGSLNSSINTQTGGYHVVHP